LLKNYSFNVGLLLNVGILSVVIIKHRQMKTHSANLPGICPTPGKINAAKAE